jgi:tocopherol O-methyltransferase
VPRGETYSAALLPPRSTRSILARSARLNPVTREKGAGRRARVMDTYNDKAKIRHHYDLISPYYQALWGDHLHHGYWIRGDETKEQAQTQLVEKLALAAKIPPGARLADIGCGFGGSSILLAKTHAVRPVGITISAVQAKMAAQAACVAGVDAPFLVMDAEALAFARESFDVVWSLESISHYQRKPEFFASAAALVRPGGVFAILDWFRNPGLERDDYEKYLRPIERGMMVSLDTMEDYASLLEKNGLTVSDRQILNERCAKTWDLCLEIIRKKEFWALALKLGPEFVHFLEAFQAMKSGFASGHFIYGLLVARKP